MSFEPSEQYASLQRAESAAYRIAMASYIPDGLALSETEKAEDIRRHNEARINIEILAALLDIGTTLKQMKS